MAVSGDHVQQLESLIEALGSQGAVARLLHTESSRVSEWLHGVTPRRARLRRIAEAAAAIDTLRGWAGGDLEALRSALVTPLPELGGSSPDQLIRQGRGSEIVSALGRRRPSADREALERDLVEALVALATAAQKSAEALTAAQGA